MGSTPKPTSPAGYSIEDCISILTDDPVAADSFYFRVQEWISRGGKKGLGGTRVRTNATANKEKD